MFYNYLFFLCTIDDHNIFFRIPVRPERVSLKFNSFSTLKFFPNYIFMLVLYYITFWAVFFIVFGSVVYLGAFQNKDSLWVAFGNISAKSTFFSFLEPSVKFCHSLNSSKFVTETIANFQQ